MAWLLWGNWRILTVTTALCYSYLLYTSYDDIMIWRGLPCYWPFVRGIHQWLVDSPRKKSVMQALLFSLMLAWTNCWTNNWVAGDLTHHVAHFTSLQFYNMISYNFLVLLFLWWLVSCIKNVMLLIPYPWLLSIWDHLVICASWWRHQMETFFAILAICAGNSPVTGAFPTQKQWHGALIYAWINGCVNNRGAGDLRCHHSHYDVSVMLWCYSTM